MQLAPRVFAYSLIVVTFGLCSVLPIEAADTPNFVLLMGDDHGWSETGYNGHPHVKTPVLDEMARTGLRFDRFYAGHPTCSPTRGSFLTGRHPNRYGTFEPGYSIRPEEITIAHLLSSAGYTCAHFGKWHLGPVKADSLTSPRKMGFDEYLSHDNFYEMNPIFSRNGNAPEEFPGEGSEVTIDETIKFIDAAEANTKPFMAVVWFGSPHEPYSGLDKDLALYADLPEAYSQRMVTLTSMKTGRPTTRPLREVLQERYAEITAMDRSIGTLREHLKKSGLQENTLVFYCGDNGSPPSTDRVTTPFREDKASVYEGGIRVPGIIEWPSRIKQPRTTDVPAVTSDLLPTLCELLDIDLPKRPLDGISLVPVLDGRLSERPHPIGFWQYDTTNLTGRKPLPEPYIEASLQEGTTPLVKYLEGKLTRSFRNFRQPPIEPNDFTGPRSFVHNRYKLVVDGDATGNETPELYDLVKDPAETENIADQQPELTQRLSKELRNWQESVLNSVTGADYEK